MILEGHKKVEFRKTRFKHAISHVVIYAAAPIQKIIGFFEVGQIDEASPEELWKRYEKVGAVESEFFWSYYKSAEKGIAIQIAEVFTLTNPIPLVNILRLEIPPQSFRYMTEEEFDKLMAVHFCIT